MNNDVVSVGPIGLFVHFKPGFSSSVGGVNKRDVYQCSLLDPFLQHFLLLGVVVTASSRDQHRLNWLGLVAIGPE